MIVGIEPTARSSSSVWFVQPDGSVRVRLSKSLGSFCLVRNALIMAFELGVFGSGSVRFPSLGWSQLHDLFINFGTPSTFLASDVKRQPVNRLPLLLFKVGAG